MKHFATQEFWECYQKLSDDIRALADRQFATLKSNPRHPCLRLKKVGIYWSARIGWRYRALAKERNEGLVWFWIGAHDAYDEMIE